MHMLVLYLEELDCGLSDDVDFVLSVLSDAIGFYKFCIDSVNTIYLH